MDLVFLILITIFLIYKLFQSLGKEDEIIKQCKDINPVIKNINGIVNTELKIDSMSGLDCSLDTKKVLEQLLKEDHTFNIDYFLDRVTKVFKMIVIAFYSNQMEPLKELLNFNVYKKFIIEINSRIREKIEQGVTVVGIKEVKIIDARIHESIVFMKLEIISEQMISNINTVDLNKNNIVSVCDIWTFSKKIQSKDFWKLTQTESR